MLVGNTVSKKWNQKNMCKLWAFGDSHIAGSGLANYNHDQIIDLKKYLKTS